ncbi:MAG: hypothetical protein MMC23_008185 [Stictis urceolatum]|nr:hypothetical protein [Stictis urceolata]
MDEQLMSSFRWLDESEPDLSLGYYDLHALKPVEVGGKGSVQTLINKRYRFLTNVSLGRNGKQNRPTSKSSHAPTEVWANTWRQSSMPPVPSIPTHASSCSRPSMSHMDSRSPRSSHGQRPANTPPPAMPNRSPLPQTGNAAEHYLDPEARLKLRLYLATPSKFDEALEFGFPPVQSSAHPRTSTSSRIQPSLVSHSRSRKSSSTALRHQPSTFPDDCPPQGGPSDVYERETMTTLSSASRPSSSYYGDSDDAGPPTPQASSPTSLAPRFVGCPQGWVDAETELERDPYSIASHGREMTLRMTLTRPDLRADESVPYPSVVRHASILKRGSVRSSAGGRSVATAKMSQDRRIPGLDGLRLDDGTAVGVEKKEGGLRKLLARRW